MRYQCLLKLTVIAPRGYFKIEAMRIVYLFAENHPVPVGQSRLIAQRTKKVLDVSDCLRMENNGMRVNAHSKDPNA
jgi:hypothetical protein